MYYPATRLLTVLELLRARGRMTGSELAARLEVDVRTVRRYIVMLQDLGMPVETERGRDGGYSLRPDYRLPPLIFSEDEAVALALGVGFARRLGMAGAVRAAETAIAKMDRAMPAALRDQVRMMDQTLAVRLPPSVVALPGDILLALSTAAYRHQRVQLLYRTPGKQPTERLLDPYGIVHTIGAWYAAGYCHLRQEIRTFRLDRMDDVTVTDTTFVPPADFDALRYVEESIARMPQTWRVDVVIHATLEEARRWIAPATAVIAPDPVGVAVAFSINDLDEAAQFLAHLPCSIEVRGPPEVRAALQRLADRIARLAAQTDDGPPPSR